MMDSLPLNHENGEICIICEQKKTKGIHLYTSFICSQCERKIISTETNDPRYKFFIKQLKKVNSTKIFH